jgi:sulfate permease, SulP family
MSLLAFPGRQDTLRGFNLEIVPSSPRRAHIWDAGTKTKPHEALIPPTTDENDEPFATLVKTFSFYGEVTRELFGPMLPYFERVCVPEGSVLWNQGDEPDGMYLIEQGILRASYAFAEHVPHTEESMVPGTTAGELSALSAMPRNATVIVEQQAVLWKLSTSKMKELEKDHPEVAHAFTQLALKSAYFSTPH